VTVLSGAAIGAGLVACSGAPARPGPTSPSPAASSLLSLSCSESAGQQGQDGETVIGGVEGLVLPGSDDPAGLYPIGSAGGTRYFIYKAFLAVAASAAPFATVSVTRPASARLVYGSPLRMGTLFNADSGRGLLAASRSRVRLPVCGPRYTGFTGGVLVTGPGCVSFDVSSAAARAAPSPSPSAPPPAEPPGRPGAALGRAAPRERRETLVPVRSNALEVRFHSVRLVCA
jgi:hypothetical protein